jgi:phosphatidylethanolamine N-methyltransferase
MSSTAHDDNVDASEVRQRLAQQPAVPQQAVVADAKQTVSDLNADEEKSTEAETKKRTYGRTPDGTGRPLFVAEK